MLRSLLNKSIITTPKASFSFTSKASNTASKASSNGTSSGAQKNQSTGVGDSKLLEYFLRITKGVKQSRTDQQARQRHQDQAGAIIFGSGYLANQRPTGMLRALKQLDPVLGDAAARSLGRMPRFTPGDTYEPLDLAHDQRSTIQKNPFAARPVRPLDAFSKHGIDVKHEYKNRMFVAEAMLSVSGRIRPSRLTGLSYKSQALASRCVKKARQLAVIPFLSKPSLLTSGINRVRQ